MTWTAPRTWVYGEVPTASLLNTHWRDNLLVLKTPASDIGKFYGLSAAYLANVSGDNVVGVIKTASGNSVTAGIQRYDLGTARIVLPVGADKWSGSGDPGSVWIEGDYLHHIDSVGDEWRFLGTYVAAQPTAELGSFWIEGTVAHYIDADGDERTVTTTTTQHADAAALCGSIWVETYIHWIRQSTTTEYVGHVDVEHDDHADHTDTTVHTDGPTHWDHDDHSDSGSGHTDWGSYQDHNDAYHVDHNDHGDHTDHSDHDNHNDRAHGDHNNHSDYTDHDDVAEDHRPELVI